MGEAEKSVLPAVQEEKKNLKDSARDFVNNIFQPLKGKDLGQTVEEFTAEMTLVAEGLSEDLERLSRQADSMAAQQTILEETLTDEMQAARTDAENVQKEIKALQKRLDKLEKSMADKKISKVAGFTGMLRQATWLCSILIGGWIVVTLIKAFVP